MQRFIFLVTVSVMLAVTSMQVQAQARMCGDREAIELNLAEKYSEQRVAAGLLKRNNSLSMLEVWTSADTGSYTVLVSTPDGRSCLVFSGENLVMYKIASSPPSLRLHRPLEPAESIEHVAPRLDELAKRTSAGKIKIRRGGKLPAGIPSNAVTIRRGTSDGA